MFWFVNIIHEDAHQKHPRGKAPALPMQDLPMPLHQDEPGHTALETDPQHRGLDQGLLPLLLERGGETA